MFHSGIHDDYYLDGMRTEEFRDPHSDGLSPEQIQAEFRQALAIVRASAPINHPLPWWRRWLTQARRAKATAVRRLLRGGR
jgi:hypothetical protein